MQRCPGVRCAVDEPMTCDVIAGIEAEEIHSHVGELIGAVVRERANLFIARSSGALLRQHSRQTQRFPRSRRRELR